MDFLTDYQTLYIHKKTKIVNDETLLNCIIYIYVTTEEDTKVLKVLNRNVVFSV